MSTSDIRSIVNNLKSHLGVSTTLAVDSSRSEVLKTASQMIQDRILYLLTLPIPEIHILTVAKHHANVGKRSISLDLASVKHFVDVTLSADEKLALLEPDSACSDVERLLKSGKHLIGFG